MQKKGPLMRISAAFPSEFLRAADLNGKTVTVTMASVSMRDIGGGEPKPVLFFEGKDKGMVLNKTNASKIAELFGDDTEEWTGGQIALYEAMVSFQGNTVPAIRVRVAPNKKLHGKKISDDPRTSAEIIDDDIPF
jgi:hypothetical protein